MPVLSLEPLPPRPWQHGACLGEPLRCIALTEVSEQLSTRPSTGSGTTSFPGGVPFAPLHGRSRRSRVPDSHSDCRGLCYGPRHASTTTSEAGYPIDLGDCYSPIPDALQPCSARSSRR